MALKGIQNWMQYMYICGKIERGEECDAEEMKLYDREKQRLEEAREEEKAYIQNRPVREANNRQYAIAELKKKFCPHIGSNCIGDECAMFKLLERPPRFGEDGCDKHYDAMCGYNIPERGDRVVR